MTYKEITQDLFESDSNTYLAHCISADFALGAGIAKAFNAKGVKDALERDYHVHWLGKGFALYTPLDGYLGVYNLVTKQYCYRKPTYKTLTEALTDMRDKLPNDCNLNMPCIGPGLDGLNWTAVSAIIRQVFEHTDVNITICRLPERS